MGPRYSLAHGPRKGAQPRNGHAHLTWPSWVVRSSHCIFFPPHPRSALGPVGKSGRHKRCSECNKLIKRSACPQEEREGGGRREPPPGEGGRRGREKEEPNQHTKEPNPAQRQTRAQTRKKHTGTNPEEEERGEETNQHTEKPTTRPNGKQPTPKHARNTQKPNPRKRGEEGRHSACGRPGSFRTIPPLPKGTRRQHYHCTGYRKGYQAQD